MNYDILTIGDIFQDVFLEPKVEYMKNAQITLNNHGICLRHGDKISISDINFSLGGSACNVAAGLDKLGYKTAIVSYLGADDHSAEIKKKLNCAGIETKFIKIIKHIKPNYSTIIVYKEERTVLLYRGLKDYSKLKLPKKIPAQWVYLGPVAEDFSDNYSTLISQAAQKGLKIAVNPGHRQIMKRREDLKKLLRVTKILILNKKEALDLTQLTPLSSEKKLLTALNNYGPEIVAITDGKNGAFAANREKYYGSEVIKVKTVDPTGAGDAFSTGFLGSYIKNHNIIKSIKWGIISGGYVAQAYGAQTMLQTQDEIEKCLSRAPEIYEL